MRFLRNALSYTLLPLILLISSCQPKKQNPCSIEIKKFYTSNNTIFLKTQNDKNCKGFKIKLTYNKEIFTLYVNFEPKVVNGAPPEGFSIKIPNKDYLSLGVDRNIVERNLPVYLKSNSTIRDLNNRVLIKWAIRVKDINKVSEIEVGNIVIKHLSKKNCRLVYNYYLTMPRIQEPVFYPLERFINLCKSRWIIEKKGTPFREVFNVNKSYIEHLRKKGDKNLLKFLGVLKPKSHLIGNNCRIHIILLDLRDYKKLNPEEFHFRLKKLNKETYERTFRKNSIIVNKGDVYVIEAMSNNYFGRSSVVVCKGGEYYVAILLKSKI